MPVTYCDVFAFLWRSVQTMGCFFDCFRVRHNDNTRPRHHPVANSSPSTTKEEATTQRIRLSSLFTNEEKEDAKERKKLVQRVGQSEVDEELMEEAKFLKACGTLPQTPAEIRKAVNFADNLEQSDLQGPHSSSKSSPETPDEVQPAKALPECLERSGLHRAQSLLETSPETPEDIRNEEISAENLGKSDLQRPRSVLKCSPNPTPRRITDDMQTPGTVFATNMKSLTKGNARIRSQYVYTVLNPIDNLCQQSELKEENRPSDHEEYFSEQGSATPFSEMKNGGDSVKKENKGDVSLSSWLKLPLPDNNGAHNNPGVASYKKPTFGRTPGDRPIIGLVATHWNEQEEASDISPKWWDGNGIPNSTTKYKEDQTVCWHATPFEERLEKALSEETSIPQRKPITGAPIVFEEAEGQDTATSQLQSINPPKSVVSF